jgi:hypothetical protein
MRKLFGGFGRACLRCGSAVKSASPVWELIAVAQEWFYAENERSVGPLSFDALTAALRRKAEPGKTLVWREDLGEWRAAREVPELAARIEKGPPLVANPDPTVDRWSFDEPAAEVWDDEAAPATWKRHWPYIAAIAILVVIVAAGVIYVSGTIRTAGEPESRVVLPAMPAEPAPPPEPPPQQEAAKPDPAIVLAQLTEKAAQAAAATDAIAKKLWAAVEPPSMQTPPNPATAARSDLESFFVDLETAEANAAAAGAQYAALLKAERDLIEEAARSSGLAEGEWAGLLATIDERHRTALELTNAMSQARGDLYRAMQGVQAIIIDQYGKYKSLADGQIRFTTKAMTDRMVAALEQERAAGRALDRIEEQMVKTRQVPQAPSEPAWKDMVKDHLGTQR